VVTGGNSGIGRAAAELLRAEGVAVAVLDVGGSAPIDVSDAAAVGRAVNDVRDDLGPVCQVLL